MPEDIWYDRLVEQMKRLGLSEAEVIRRADLSESWFSDRKKGKAQQPKLGTICKLAAAVEWSVAELLGEGLPEGLRLIIQHRILANEMWADNDSENAEDISLGFLSHKLVTFEIDTDEYKASGYRRGDIVSGEPTEGIRAHNLIGKECIVLTKDGRKLFKILDKGSKARCFNLKSFDAFKNPMTNVEIVWAAPIQIILRGVT